jgi:hypothetical protein
LQLGGLSGTMNAQFRPEQNRFEEECSDNYSDGKICKSILTKEQTPTGNK